MAHIVLLAHLPLLRIEEDMASIGQGTLWRMPYSVFDQLTAGAYSDRKSYELTAPVFLRTDADLDLSIVRPGPPEGGKALEIKGPPQNWAVFDGIGLQFLRRFHAGVVDPVWAALRLAAPAAALPSPMMSLTFAGIADTDTHFEVSGNSTRTIRIQGEADHEYLFLPDTACAPLPPAAIARASEIIRLLDTITGQPELLGALRTLLGSGHPTLSAREQLTLCVIGLESLLLPEIKSGLSKTLAQRTKALLGVDAEHQQRLERIARVLYDVRSASVHGTKPRSPEEASAAATQASAQQILAAAIYALVERLSSHPSLEILRSELDLPPEQPSSNASNPGLAALPDPDPPGQSVPDRLGRRRVSIAAQYASTSLVAPDGIFMSWSPLLGTSLTEPLTLGAAAFIPLTGPEIVSLEEKDIRRDFIAQLHMSEHQIASIAVGQKLEDSAQIDAAIARTTRIRDLVVTAMRIAGLTAFQDPELLGLFAYHGSIRFRRPTVLRQTILQGLQRDPQERLTPAIIPSITAAWHLLSSYDATAANSELDHVLTLFRRGFDQEFLPPPTRASLVLAAFEICFGRFRKKDDPIQLEDLVGVLMPPNAPAATWFAQHGRAFRNAVAHGAMRDPASGDADLASIVEILRIALPRIITCWLDAPNRSAHRPGALFIRHLTATLHSGRKP